MKLFSYQDYADKTSKYIDTLRRSFKQEMKQEKEIYYEKESQLRRQLQKEQQKVKEMESEKQGLLQKKIVVEKLKQALELLEEMPEQVEQSSGNLVFVHPEPPKPTEKAIISSEASTSPEDHQSPRMVKE